MEINDKKLKQILKEQREEYQKYLKEQNEDFKRHTSTLSEEFSSQVKLIGEQYSSIKDTLDLHTWRKDEIYDHHLFRFPTRSCKHNGNFQDGRKC